jgi:hypothetical protein
MLEERGPEASSFAVESCGYCTESNNARHKAFPNFISHSQPVQTDLAKLSLAGDAELLTALYFARHES